MDTPIYDFVQRYSQNGISRLHMPGHKGARHLGCENLDITEISCADYLYEASGIIGKSENNASKLFGSDVTLYSTEGSTQCIKAMLYLAVVNGRKKNERPLILATRNAHKSFILASALLDFDIAWIWPEDRYFSRCTCVVSAKLLDKYILGSARIPSAVYITTPDYLGTQLDIGALAEICHRYNIPLLVDNAHGAYSHFLENSEHPMDHMADVCCDSAHKTLPVLTGGAYLHISSNAPEFFKENARKAMSIFGSTSPSYLVLQSLDLANPYLYGDYRKKLKACCEKVTSLKNHLCNLGWHLYGSELLKLTVNTSLCGYTGFALADILRTYDVECEYSDPDFLVMMFTPDNSDVDYERISSIFSDIPIGSPLEHLALSMPPPQVAMTPRNALLNLSESIPVAESEGRILSSPTVSCPPAIPICVSGEIISSQAIEVFKYYGITDVNVVK